MIPKGFRFAGVRCGLKNKKNDIGLVFSDRPARCAGVFTTNFVRAACVDHTQSVVARETARALVVNSGNANCCTGEQGALDTVRMAELAAAGLGVSPEEVGVASTGVIGQPLDMAKVERGIGEAAGKLGESPRPFLDAILTTDLVEKWAAVTVGSPSIAAASHPETALQEGARIYGAAKGSGMIAPNMATMLGFVVSDADVSGLDLPAIVKRVAAETFNRCTVDGDTSTNDMLLVLANGASGIAPDEASFEMALHAVCDSLARQIARDGEGATKLVEVRVTGTADPAKIARTIAESPLVKTAMFGCDPNWGRVMMAAGRAGVPFRVADVRLAIEAHGAEHLLFDRGTPTPFDPKRASAALKSDHVVIAFDAGIGETATVYTCDFGYGYVRINAEYHT